MVAYGLTHFSQQANATVDSSFVSINWSIIDAEFESIIAPTSKYLSSDLISTVEAGDNY